MPCSQRLRFDSGQFPTDCHALLILLQFQFWLEQKQNEFQSVCGCFLLVQNSHLLIQFQLRC